MVNGDITNTWLLKSLQHQISSKEREELYMSEDLLADVSYVTELLIRASTGIPIIHINASPVRRINAENSTWNESSIQTIQADVNYVVYNRMKITIFLVCNHETQNCNVLLFHHWFCRYNGKHIWGYINLYQLEKKRMCFWNTDALVWQQSYSGTQQ